MDKLIIYSIAYACPYNKLLAAARLYRVALLNNPAAVQGQKFLSLQHNQELYCSKKSRLYRRKQSYQLHY